MTYDPEADALAVNLRPLREAMGGVEVAPGQFVHQDPEGRIVSIEILRASEYVGRAALEQLPDGTLWLTIGESAKESGLQEGTLRNIIRSGRLPAVKRGRDWLVAAHELWNYQETKSPRGRKAKRKPRRRRTAAHPSGAQVAAIGSGRTPAPAHALAAAARTSSARPGWVGSAKSMREGGSSRATKRSFRSRGRR
jgi:excisionase family DNA binding protein